MRTTERASAVLSAAAQLGRKRPDELTFRELLVLAAVAGGWTAQDAVSRADSALIEMARDNVILPPVEGVDPRD